VARCQHANRILDYRAAGPGARPLAKYVVSFDEVVEAGDKTLLGFLVISGEQERKQMEAAHIFPKYSGEIGARGVNLWFRSRV
jgi:hypothetical protein